MNFAVKSHACDILSVLGQKHPKKLKICQINYILPVRVGTKVLMPVYLYFCVPNPTNCQCIILVLTFKAYYGSYIYISL